MDKPDYYIEQFWLGLKDSMINFYHEKITKRPIIKWSDNLNKLQKEEKYEDIEKNIRNYISLYGIDLMRQMDFYHLGILKTNIKRWNNISNHYGFNKEDEKKYYNIIFLLIDIYEKLYKNLSENDFTEFSTEIELLIINEDFNSLIDICVKYKLESTIDKLSNYIDVLKILNTKYNLKLKYNISGKKLFKIIF